MLQTNLKHITTTEQFNELLKSGKKAAIVCGRMGPMCIPVYDVMETLESKYPDISFFDMEFDSPTGESTIRKLPEVQSFRGLPFTVYIRDGKIAAATTSIQSRQQVKEILDSKMI